MPKLTSRTQKVKSLQLSSARFLNKIDAEWLDGGSENVCSNANENLSRSVN